jgi:hypothetical protein
MTTLEPVAHFNPLFNYAGFEMSFFILILVQQIVRGMP